MKSQLPEEILAFGESARGSFEALGGIRFAYAVEAEPGRRAEAAAVLERLGAWELDVRGEPDDLLAAAELCRAAGAVALPYPLVPELLRVEGARVELVDPANPRIDHGGLEGPWSAADLAGGVRPVITATARSGRLGPFVAKADLGPPAGRLPEGDVSLALTLASWRALGCAESAVAMVCEHLNARIQFGKPLAAFQAVRFAVADAVVGVQGLAELAKFTAWRLTSAPPQAAADALMLKLKAVDTTRAVLRACHQLVGAVGFCDEHDLSVLDRHIQPILRLPVGPEELAELLMPCVLDGTVETLFSEPAR